MEEYQENGMQDEQNVERPQMLTVLCVLSFINAVFSVISNLISFLFYDSFRSLFQQMKDGEGIFEAMAEQMGSDWDMMVQSSSMVLSVGRGYYFVEILLFAASFYGVYMMWKLQKNGFHVYTVTQILMLIVSSVMIVGKIGGSLFGPIFWTIFFVAMYFPYYKRVMK